MRDGVLQPLSTGQPLRSGRAFTFPHHDENMCVRAMRCVGVCLACVLKALFFRREQIAGSETTSGRLPSTATRMNERTNESPKGDFRVSSTKQRTNGARGGDRSFLFCVSYMRIYLFVPTMALAQDEIKPRGFALRVSPRGRARNRDLNFIRIGLRL